MINEIVEFLTTAMLALAASLAVMLAAGVAAVWLGVL